MAKQQYILVNVPKLSGHEYVRADYDIYESLYKAFLNIFLFDIKPNGNLVCFYQPDINNDQLITALKPCSGVDVNDLFVQEQGYSNEEVTYKFLIEYEKETAQVIAIYDSYLSGWSNEDYRRIDMTNLFLRSNVNMEQIDANKLIHSVVKGMVLEATANIEVLQTAVDHLVNRFIPRQPSYKISRASEEKKQKANHAIASEQALRSFKHTFFAGLDNQIGQFLQSPELKAAQNIAKETNKQDPSILDMPVLSCTN